MSDERSSEREDDREWTILERPGQGIAATRTAYETEAHIPVVPKSRLQAAESRALQAERERDENEAEWKRAWKVRMDELDAEQKQRDIETAARAEFALMKGAGIAELECVDWDDLADVANGFRHPMLSKQWYRGEVTPAVEALWRAGRLDDGVEIQSDRVSLPKATAVELSAVQHHAHYLVAAWENMVHNSGSMRELHGCVDELRDALERFDRACNGEVDIGAELVDETTRRRYQEIGIEPDEQPA